MRDTMDEKKEKYIYTQNRELSWLRFNKRVLEEATDISVPLLERLKFTEIFTSNLDEFFMVRVGSLKDMTLLEEKHIDNKSGLSPEEQLSAVFEACRPLYDDRDRIFGDTELELRSCNICRLSVEELSTKHKKEVSDWFHNEMQPLLSPQLIDIHHPFPHLSSKNLNIILHIEVENKKSFGIIPVPAELPRVLYFDGPGIRYILLEDVLLYFADEVFNAVRIIDKAIFSITRNADISPEDEAFDIDEDYCELMKKVIRKRTRLAAVRLEIELDNRISEKEAEKDKKLKLQKSPELEKITEFLIKKLDLKKEQVFFSSSPLDLKYVYQLQGRLTSESEAALCYKEYTPRLPGGSLGLDMKKKLIPQVLSHDVLLHYPYDSMEPFLQLIKEASADPEVVSIKITIYRMASKTKLAEYLCAAAENGKSVTVIMELRARFDEQNNIQWAERFEESGCTILYGIDGFKVHSKICQITRRGADGQLRYITQIGTGNYNEKTAMLYVDLCLMTADPEIGADGAQLFQNLALANLGVEYNKLLASPFEMRDKVLGMIDEEIKKGTDGYIFLKMNSLTDRDVIDKLAEASRAGVKVVMNIRGICCLLPGVSGHTENITVFSIVGRFLEHTRIYRFGRGNSAKLYISSADFMTRNMQRRVEIACPIENEAARKKIFWIIDTYLSDNVKARIMDSEGKYHCIRPEDGSRAAVTTADTADKEPSVNISDELSAGTAKGNDRHKDMSISCQDVFMREQPEFKITKADDVSEVTSGKKHGAHENNREKGAKRLIGSELYEHIRSLFDIHKV